MKHEQLKGIISMRPGQHAGDTCSCGWHSHTKTFEEHMAEVRGERG